MVLGNELLGFDVAFYLCIMSLIRAAAILDVDNRFRIPSLNVWERVSVRKNKSFQSLGTQHGRRVIKTKARILFVKKRKKLCTCCTHLSAFLCRTTQNDNVISPNLRFWRQRERATRKSSFLYLYFKTVRPHPVTAGVVCP